MAKRFVERIDKEVAHPFLGCGELMQGLDNALQKSTTGIHFTAFVRQSFLDRRDLELFGIAGQTTGEHRRETLHEPRRAEGFKLIALTAMVANDLPAGIGMYKLGHDA